MSEENAQEKFFVLQQLRAERESLMQKKKDGFYLMYSREGDSHLQTEGLSSIDQKKEGKSFSKHEDKNGKVWQDEEADNTEEGVKQEKEEEPSLESVTFLLVILFFNFIEI